MVASLDHQEEINVHVKIIVFIVNKPILSCQAYGQIIDDSFNLLRLFREGNSIQADSENIVDLDLLEREQIQELLANLTSLGIVTSEILSNFNLFESCIFDW